MKIANLSDFLVRSYMDERTRKISVFIEGPSGIGKSDVVRQTDKLLAEKIPNWAGHVDLRLSQCDVTDLRGVPSVVNGRTTWNIPEFFPKEGTSGIFFVDELTNAPPSMQAVGYQLMLDRLHMPDGWMVVAAGNRMSDKGVTFQMAAPLTNRMTKIEVQPELEGFLIHASRSGIRPEIMAFVAERADLLHKFDGKQAGAQFPSPRGWFRASLHLDMVKDDNERVEVLIGDVGHEGATTFEAFMRVWETMPKLTDIYKDPDSIAVPKKLDVQHCIAMGIAATVDAKTFANALKFLNRMPTELLVLVVKLAIARDKDLARAPGFVEMALKYQAVWSY